MQIELEKDTEEKVSRASELLGIGKQELVDRALVVYIDSIGRMLDLKRELREWDVLSDEALRNFEKSL